MNKTGSVIIIGIFIVLSFFLGYFIKGMSVSSSEIQNLQNQIAILQNENNELQQQINELQGITSDDISQNASIDTDCCTQTQKELGYKCVQGCGLPVVRSGEEYEISYSCLSPEQVENRERYGCPICLSSQSKISTPKGEISVKELETGMLVWTLDNNGKIVAQPILKVTASLVPDNHEVVHMILKDGRELWVSPGHPTIDGGTVEKLQVGHPYDGSFVTSLILEKYQEQKTYDLLPAGETGYYWANGILMDSTLKR